MARDLPDDLREQLGALDAAGDGYDDPAAFVERLPDDRPAECPDCGADLTATAVYVDGAGDAVAVRLACKGRHDGRAASYVYDVDDGSLYLATETSPETAGSGL